MREKKAKRTKSYLAVLSPLHLKPPPGVVAYRYRDLFERALDGSLTRDVDAECWVLFDLGNASVQDARLLKGLVKRLREVRRHLIVVGNPDELLVKITSELLEESLKPLEPILNRYKFKPSPDCKTQAFRDLLRDLEKRVPKNRAPYSLSPSRFTMFKNVDSRGERYQYSPLATLVTTTEEGEVVAAMYAFEGGGSICLFPFWNFRPSVRNAEILHSSFAEKILSKEPKPSTGSVTTQSRSLRTTKEAISEFTHDPGFTLIYFKGVPYTPKTSVSIVVKVLHDNYRAGNPVVHFKEILEAIRVETGRHTPVIADVLKGSPLWGTLIRMRKNAHYYLDLTSPCASCPTGP